MILASGELIRRRVVEALGGWPGRPPAPPSPWRFARVALVVGALGAAGVLAALVLALGRGGGGRGPRRRGGHLEIVRCPVHGIAHDVELEACPECAKAGEIEPGLSRRGRAG